MKNSHGIKKKWSQEENSRSKIKILITKEKFSEQKIVLLAKEKFSEGNKLEF